MTTYRHFIRASLMFLLLVLVGCGVFWEYFLTTPLITDTQGLRYNVKQGASFKSVANDLHQLHLLTHPYLFTLLVVYRGDVHALKAGEYFFPKGTTPSRLIDQIATGTGMIYHTFTVVPGMTFRQLRQALDKNTELSHITKQLTDAEIMKRLGHAGLHPEGQFYPDSYYFVVDSSDFILLKRAFQAMQMKLQLAWEHRAPTLYFQTPYEALIAASIIEKEAHVKEELPIIAGVLSNRLRQGMLLQFDPTVIYGIGQQYNGAIYKKDLTDPNPYNTYVHKGLPPTPISMPGKYALEAVMHPQTNDYFYFVAKGDGMTHHFSRTLTEHHAAVVAAKQYQPSFFNVELVQRYLLRQLQPF